jgi:sulfide:quinone oxidoreductase
MGSDEVAKVDVDFLSGPAPVARFTAPSADAASEKAAFASSRRNRWFGDAAATT